MVNDILDDLAAYNAFYKENEVLFSLFKCKSNNVNDTTITFDPFRLTPNKIIGKQHLNYKEAICAMNAIKDLLSLSLEELALIKKFI